MYRYVEGLTKVPPGDYQYIHPEDGHVTRHIILEEAKKEAKRYRTINHYPIPQDFDRTFEDSDCRRKPPGFCIDADTRKAYDTPLRRHALTGTEILSGSKFAVDFIARGEYAPEDEIERRISICKGCEFNVPFDEGCFTCAGSKAAHATMNLLIAKKRFKDDDKLRACFYCGCSNRAQVQVKLEFLHEHLPETINDQLPDHCWKKRV